jgi:hypothetical protein
MGIDGKTSSVSEPGTSFIASSPSGRRKAFYG